MLCRATATSLPVSESVAWSRIDRLVASSRTKSKLGSYPSSTFLCLGPPGLSGVGAGISGLTSMIFGEVSSGRRERRATMKALRGKGGKELQRALASHSMVSLMIELT